MLKQINIVDLLSAIQKHIESNTKLKCFDYVTENTASPFYFMELVNSKPSNSKTMFKTTYSINIHVVAEKNINNSSVALLEYVRDLEEAMTIDIDLKEPFQMLMQMNNGIQSIGVDETEEKYAIVNFEFTVCYGLICK